MKWLKLWTEARNDGKLRSLDDRQHRIWFSLLCFVGEQEPPGTVRASWKLLAVECADGDIEAARDAVSEMESLLLVTVVTCNEETIEVSFPSFQKRQSRYPSDDRQRVAERVAKCRAAKRSAMTAKSNGHVTRSNERNGTDSDSDTEKKKPPSPKREEIVFVLPDWIPRDVWDAWLEMRRKIRKPVTDRARDMAVKRLEGFRAEGHDPVDSLQAAIIGSYQGLFPTNGRGPAATKKFDPPLRMHRAGDPL